jgi:hypothetical protein
MKRRLLQRTLSLSLAWCCLGLMLSASSCNAPISPENASICLWDESDRLRLVLFAMKNEPGSTVETARQRIRKICDEEHRQHDTTRNNGSCAVGGCDRDDFLP